MSGTTRPVGARASAEHAKKSKTANTYTKAAACAVSTTPPALDASHVKNKEGNGNQGGKYGKSGKKSYYNYGSYQSGKGKMGAKY